VTLAIGIFDLFTYTIPGSLYLAFFGYLGARLHWIDPGAVGRAPVLLLGLAIVVASYLLGYLAYPLGEAANQVLPQRHERRPHDESSHNESSRGESSRKEFLKQNPAAHGRGYIGVDPFLLLSAVQLHDNNAAIEVTRLRACGLMLRNSAPPLMLGFVAALVEVVVGPNPVFAAGCAVLFAVWACSLIIQGRRLRNWANLKTLELCFWLPDIDERCRVVGKTEDGKTEDAA